MNFKKIGLLFGSIFTVAFGSYATIELPDIISDNMVLQQQSDARLWGWATPGATVTVKPSWEKANTVKARADSTGRWELTVSTPKASFTPYVINVKGDGSDVTLENVLVGEVWFCTGQSNMEMPIKGYNLQPVEGAAEAVSEAWKYPGIRMASVPHAQSYTPQDRVAGKWQLNEPANVWDFSAMAYFFARELTNWLNVPVGIVHSSYGGSKVECWESRELLEQYPECDIDREAADPNFNHMHRINAMYNAMLHPLIGYTIKGFIWNQGESNVGEHETYPYHLKDMVSDWRSKWELGELPFYMVEIPGWEYAGADKIDAALFRECQHNATKIIPNSDIVCSADLFYPDQQYCIHPPLKEKLGRRMAHLVAERTYGIDGLPTKYPEFVSFEANGCTASIKISNVPQGIFPILT